MEIRTDIKQNEVLRNSFFDLACKVFGLDLGSWYDKGFWTDDYVPYSVIEDGKVVSNVSLNIINVRWKGRIRHLAQLGTVMTDEAYRGRGCINAIMEKIAKDRAGVFEGIYLYANSDKTDFYGRFGFRRRYEYRCSKDVNITNPGCVEKVPMNTKEDWERMVDIIQRRDQYGDRIMMGNPGLFMFYLSGPMSECVYYVPSCEAYAVASVKGDTLRLYAVFSEEKVGLGDVIASFGRDIDHVELAFAPENSTGFERRKIEDEDDALFVKGDIFEGIDNEKFMFPEISHA